MISHGGKNKSLGTFGTKQQAGIAYDRFVVDKSTNEVSYTLNYPNMSDIEREEARKKRKLSSKNTSGYTGVCNHYTSGYTGTRFQARIDVGGGKVKYLGTWDTAKQAAIAYDRAVVQYNLRLSRLNFPDGLPNEEDDDEILNPTKRRELQSNNTTGFTGVSTEGRNKKKFKATIKIEGKSKYLATFDTAYEAALAFDRAVIQYNLCLSRLNFQQDKNASSSSSASTVHSLDRRPPSTAASGYRGVCEHTPNRFSVRLHIKGIKYKFGPFDRAVEAAEAYDNALRKHGGNLRLLNFEFTNADFQRDIALIMNNASASAQDATQQASRNSSSSSSSSSSRSSSSSSNSGSSNNNNSISAAQKNETKKKKAKKKNKKRKRKS